MRIVGQCTLGRLTCIKQTFGACTEVSKLPSACLYDDDVNKLVQKGNNSWIYVLKINSFWTTWPIGMILYWLLHWQHQRETERSKYRKRALIGSSESMYLSSSFLTSSVQLAEQGKEIVKWRASRSNLTAQAIPGRTWPMVPLENSPRSWHEVDTYPKMGCKPKEDDGRERALQQSRSWQFDRGR